MTYPDWCERHGVTHGHCPLDCEHPQPLLYRDKLVCGRCLILCRTVSEIVPCGPENCDETGVNHGQEKDREAEASA
jgi:hypothetical protein